MRGLLVFALSLTITAPAFAQRADARFEASQDTVVNRPTFSILRVAKWASLLASGGAAVYGFTENRAADREYEEIEQLCQDQPDACATVPGSTTYLDPALEARYQDVLQRDDRARLALLMGQIGLAASVLMFILDLPEGTTTDDIPYDPRPVRLHLGRRHVELGLHLEIR